MGVLVCMFMQNVHKYASLPDSCSFFEETPNLLTQQPGNALYIVVSGWLAVAGTPNLSECLSTKGFGSSRLGG